MTGPFCKRSLMLCRCCELVLLLLLAFPTAPAQGQLRLGILVQEMGRAQSQAIKGLGEGFKGLGYQEKKNLFFETRNVKGNRAELQPAAAEILAKKVNAIFTTGTSATRAAITATTDIPIVFVHPADPVASGLIKNNGERANNLTGVAAYAAQTTERRLLLFKEIYPGLRNIVVFFNANNSFSRDQYAVVDTGAKKLGWKCVGYPIKSQDELKTTFAGLRSESGTGIFQIADELLESENEFVFETARQKKLPTMFNEEAWAIEGAMAAYGPNYLEMGRVAARLIDRIFKGEKPEKLPIERAAKFDLILNYRTANFIGFQFSPEILKKADKVIR